MSATLFSEKNQRIVSVNNFRVEFKPEGTLLYIINKDVPGVVGKVERSSAIARSTSPSTTWRARPAAAKRWPSSPSIRRSMPTR